MTDEETQKIKDNAIAEAKPKAEKEVDDFMSGIDYTKPGSKEENEGTLKFVESLSSANATSTQALPTANAEEPGTENGKTYLREDDSGTKKGVTRFGGLYRVVDQDDTSMKNVRWTDLEGKSVAEPASERMRKMMSEGHTLDSLTRAGFGRDGGDVWENALAVQEQNAGDERLAKSRMYSDRVLEAQRMEKSAIRKRRANAVLALGDATKVALAELNDKIKLDSDTMTVFDKQDKPVDPRVRMAKNGDIYLIGSLNQGALNTLNQRRSANGGSELTSVAAVLKIDKYGNRLKNADGSDIDPTIAVTDQKGKERQFNRYSLREVSNWLYDAHKAAGNGTDAAIQNEVIGMLGGRNPSGWARPTSSSDWHTDVARINAASNERINLVKSEYESANKRRDLISKYYQDRITHLQKQLETAPLEKRPGIEQKIGELYDGMLGLLSVSADGRAGTRDGSQITSQGDFVRRARKMGGVTKEEKADRLRNGVKEAEDAGFERTDGESDASFVSRYLRKARPGLLKTEPQELSDQGTDVGDVQPGSSDLDDAIRKSGYGQKMNDPRAPLKTEPKEPSDEEVDEMVKRFKSLGGLIDKGTGNFIISDPIFHPKGVKRSYEAISKEVIDAQIAVNKAKADFKQRREKALEEFEKEAKKRFPGNPIRQGLHISSSIGDWGMKHDPEILSLWQTSE